VLITSIKTAVLLVLFWNIMMQTIKHVVLIMHTEQLHVLGYY